MTKILSKLINVVIVETGTRGDANRQMQDFSVYELLFWNVIFMSLFSLKTLMLSKSDRRCVVCKIVLPSCCKNQIEDV